jgi:predicted acyl esterase
MVQTNGPHDIYESQVFRRTLVGFLDHFVKGLDNGFERGPHLAIWLETGSTVQGRLQLEQSSSRAIITAARYPAAVTPVFYALDADGQLKPAHAGEAGAGRGEQLAYPIPGPTIDADELIDRWGTLPEHWHEGSVAYTSPVLEERLLSYGPASADLWVASTGSDADLQATLTEVRPDGQEMFVQRGVLRVSDRAQDDSRSNLLRPYPIDRAETMSTLVPGVPVLARVELTKFAHLFREGSRLRLWIDTPSQYGGNGFAPYSQPSTLTVLHDALHPSRLALGAFDAANEPEMKLPAERAACGSLLKQPCRPDPLAPSGS